MGRRVREKTVWQRDAMGQNGDRRERERKEEKQEGMVKGKKGSGEERKVVRLLLGYSERMQPHRPFAEQTIDLCDNQQSRATPRHHPSVFSMSFLLFSHAFLFLFLPFPFVFSAVCFLSPGLLSVSNFAQNLPNHESW